MIATVGAGGFVRIATSLLLGFALAGAMGCGDDDLSACVPGRVDSCPCLGGGSGVQTCGPDGTYGACTCSATDAGGIDASAIDAGVDAGATIDAGAAEDASAVDAGASDVDSSVPSVDAGGVPVHGHAVVMGLHPFAGPDDALDAFLMNSLFVTERAGTIRILDYVAHSSAMTDPFFQMDLHGRIDAEATRRGRTVSYATLSTDSGLAAALSTADVLYVYPQLFDESTARTTATFWHDDLLAFLTGGGVVVVTSSGTGGCGTCGYEFRLLEGTSLFSFSGGAAPFSMLPTIEVTAPTDPIAAGVVSPFVPTSGNTECFSGSARGVVVARSTTTLCPVVRHLVF